MTEMHLQMADGVREEHIDLSHRYKNHAVAVTAFWRSLDTHGRYKCIHDFTLDLIPLHRKDVSRGLPGILPLGYVSPEVNLCDMMKANSDYLLDMMEYRASTSLTHQCFNGPEGSLGDIAFADGALRDKRLMKLNLFGEGYILFVKRTDGISFKILKEHDGGRAGAMAKMDVEAFVPQEVGYWAMRRQITILSFLNLAIDYILYTGSTTKIRGPKPQKINAPSEALAKLSNEATSTKLSVPELIASALDQQTLHEEFLSLLSSEPVRLRHTVSIWAESHPGQLPDEKGRWLQNFNDRHTNTSFFEAVHHSLQTAAVWKYVRRLLDLLAGLIRGTEYKIYRATILQELSNVCDLAYIRAQLLFKRKYLVDWLEGFTWFKRLSNVYESDGQPRVVLKRDPSGLMGSNSQMYYMLHLCQPKVKAPEAVCWLQKLWDLYQSHPLEREKLQMGQAEGLSELASTVAFLQDLSLALKLPTVSSRKGQTFVSKFRELEKELNEVKRHVDVRDFAAPIHNLEEPGMAEGALQALEDTVVEKTGTKFGFLYEELVDGCTEKLHQVCKDKMKAQQEANLGSTLICQPDRGLEPQQSQPKSCIEQRRMKEKTRPSRSTVFDITPSADTGTSAASDERAAFDQWPKQKIKVSPATAMIFSTLFDKGQARGSVAWTAFEGAMADLGFSVLPRYGSVYRFSPSEALAKVLGNTESLTLHRPHTSSIEGHLLLFYAKRLNKLYCLGKEGAFEVSR